MSGCVQLRGGVVVSGGVEKGEHYDDVVELTYKTKADNIP